MALWNLYVGTFTAEFEYLSSAPSEGIERCEFDDTNGTVRHVETITGIRSPQYLEMHPTHAVLYATEFAHPGTLITYDVNHDGTLERRSTTESLGELAVAVRIHPSEQFAYVANWGSGTLSAFPLAKDGTVISAQPVAEPARTNPRDPSEMHPHQFVPTPGGNAVLAAYAGGDELTAYSADASGTLSSLPVVRIEFPPESAPRHIEFHPSGRYVYVVGERDSMLHVLEAEDGLPTRYLKAYSTVPSDYTGGNGPSELVRHPEGDTLYVGNRGADCITIFSLDDSGGVEALDHQSSIGQGPRAVRVDPTGRYLLVGNCASGDLAVFEIEEDRRLRLVGSPLALPSPSSLVFSRAADR